MRHSTALLRASFAYTSVILIGYVARWAVGDDWWWLAIINHTAFYCFLPLLILLLLTLVRRRGRALAVLLAPLVVFLSLWGPLLLPSGGSVAADNALTAMTFNVLFSNATPDGVVASIRAANPDIVGLQELEQPVIMALTTQLADDYPYHTFDQAGPRGVGILSRYPIISVAEFPFPPRPHRALHTVIDGPQRPFHVLVTHFQATNLPSSPPADWPAQARERYGQRVQQVADIEAEIAGSDEPFLLLCDCNFSDTSAAYKLLSQQLNDSYREVGWGLGHTSRIPNLPGRYQRIDYIWHNAAWRAVDASTGRSGGSDHHPVIVRLVLATS